MALTDILNANIAVLEEGIGLLDNMSGPEFSATNPAYYSSSIGKHIRHIVDHYYCLLNGQASGDVDYDQRDRDTQIEDNIDVAKTAINELIGTIRGLIGSAENKLIDVSLSCDTSDRDPAPVRSSFERELLFVHSHTTHHFALISLIVKMMGIPVKESFGVAPSTLKHEGQTLCAQ